MKQVRDLMSTDCKTVTLQDNIYEAAQIMAQNDCGFVPVVEVENNRKMIGVVTDRDLVIRGYARKQPGSASIKDVMSDSSLISCSPEMDVHQAADLMAEHQVRRLPVVENGQLVGIIAIGDLAVERININEAGQALSNISQNTDHHLQ